MYELCHDDPEALFALLLEEELDAWYEAHASDETEA